MFTPKKFVSSKFPGEYLDYLCYEPQSGEKMPLIIKLPGAGGRGTDLKQLGTGGFFQAVTEMGGVPARAVVPQCRFETWFDYFHVLCEFIETQIHQPDIDAQRVYLMGTSMGAYCAWQLCISHPEWFAAAVPVCGGGMYWDAGRIQKIPVWAFHGEKDDTVYCCESEFMVDRINQCGGNAKLTILPDVNHNAWDYAYFRDDMWQWLFEQKKEC